MIALLQISWRMWQWKNFENRPVFDEVMCRLRRLTFLAHPVDGLLIWCDGEGRLHCICHWCLCYSRSKPDREQEAAAEVWKLWTAMHFSIRSDNPIYSIVSSLVAIICFFVVVGLFAVKVTVSTCHRNPHDLAAASLLRCWQQQVYCSCVNLCSSLLINWTYAADGDRLTLYTDSLVCIHVLC